MMTELLERTQRGVTFYREQYPDMYGSYKKQLDHLQSQIGGLVGAIRMLNQETPQPGDPITGQQAV